MIIRTRRRKVSLVDDSRLLLVEAWLDSFFRNPSKTRILSCPVDVVLELFHQCISTGVLKGRFPQPPLACVQI